MVFKVLCTIMACMRVVPASRLLRWFQSKLSLLALTLSQCCQAIEHLLHNLEGQMNQQIEAKCDILL